MKTQLQALALVVFMACSALADCPEGDLNRDCKVDLFDFATLADSWLQVEPNLPTGTVVINEVMAHSSGTAPDWIELYNTSGSAIDISGWYLSDSDRELTSAEAYQIPNGTTIPAYGYVVFYENAFGTKFKLSENGDEVYLSLLRDGVPFGMDDRKFDASEPNVSFGRYTTSIGEVKFVSMDPNTPGAANSYPKVGPVVINEVMYYADPCHPDSDVNEYIELYNIEDYNVNLWIPDPCGPGDVNWAITKGVEYEFPYHTTIPSHGYLLVVKNKPAFTSTFPSVPSSIVFEWDSGKLSNEGENIELSMPGELDTTVIPNERYYIRIDNVIYSDGEHHQNFPGLDPWAGTRSANGTGDSLHRINPNLFGDDVNNWASDAPDPCQ
jgi:hypothetical protein